MPLTIFAAMKISLEGFIIASILVKVACYCRGSTVLRIRIKALCGISYTVYHMWYMISYAPYGPYLTTV